jgi:MscS family membrane protein
MINNIDEEAAAQMAIRLKHIFDGNAIYLDDSDFPVDPDYFDSLTNKHKYTLSKQLPEVYVVKVGSQWFYSKKTIQSIDELFKKTYPFGTYRLLNILPKTGNNKFLGLNYWQLIGLLIIILVCFIIHKILTLIIEKFLLQFLLRRASKEVAQILLRRVAKPLSLFLVVWLATVLVPSLQLPVNNYYKYIPLILKASLPIYATMVVYMVVDVLSLYLTKLADRTETTLDDQLVPLIRKALKTFVVIIGVFYTLVNLNVDIVPLLTGLSIGGLAFALAAQDTIKNFFGSVMIFVDKPFQIGDWISSGDIDGTVEEVGFRSTRIRTFRNSVVYVPNGILADSTIDNHGLRVYRRFFTKLAITYDTPTDLITVFVKGLEKIVVDHPDTRKDYYNVYLNDLGAHSLDVMFYIFFEVPNWQDELKARQEILLSIMQLAEAIGIRFAFPTQTLHMETFPDKSTLTPEYNESLEEMETKMKKFFEGKLEN